MRRLLKALPILAVIVAIVAYPAAAFAQDGLSFSFTSIANSFLGESIGTVGIVALLGAVAAFALALTHYLPGWATRLNGIAGIAGAAAVKIGLLGPKAGAIAILIALIGAWTGYERSEARAEGKSVLS